MTRSASPTIPNRRTPTRTIAFRRLHGLGNDYVFVHHRELDGVDASELARAVADRHRGVGGDGLISVAALEGPEAGGPSHLIMRMWNADGSSGGMCGNGVRGVVRFAVEEGLVRRERASESKGVLVEIGSRRTTCRLLASGSVFQVRVDMGPANFDWASVPFLPERAAADASAPRLRRTDEEDLLGSVVPLPDALLGWAVASMGNPHLVLVVPDAAVFEGVPLASIGPSLERAAAFPERTNVHVVQVEDRTAFRMRTWERGTGPTLACGSGACAAFATLHRVGMVDGAARASLEGGDLDLALGTDGGIRMTGPSEACCRGNFDLEAILPDPSVAPVVVEIPAGDAS